MSRRPNTIGGQFAPRIIEMLESPAYRALSLSAHRVLARLEIEQANHGGKDNGKLPCTYDDFEAYGIHRHAISAALHEVVALGFVEITKPGRAGNAEFRTPNIFRLTYVNTKREAATHEWRRVATDEAALVAARKARCTAKARPKNKTPVVEKARPSGGNHHRNHSTETTTTRHSTETTTTLDISGRGSLACLQRMSTDNGPRSAPSGERASGPGRQPLRWTTPKLAEIRNRDSASSEVAA